MGIDDDGSLQLKLYVSSSVFSLFSFFPVASSFLSLLALSSFAHIIFRPNGKTFTVPRDDVHVPRPSLGDIVSFSYDENVRYDIPTRPSVFRIRTDIEWDDVIDGARSDRHRSSGKPARGRAREKEE